MNTKLNNTVNPSSFCGVIVTGRSDLKILWSEVTFVKKLATLPIPSKLSNCFYLCVKVIIETKYPKP